MEFDPELPLVSALTELARIAPDQPAVTCGNKVITRGELDRRTNQLARAYIELGVKPDSFVSIALPNSIEFYEAAIATWKVGATPQPLSNKLPARERDAIIELADPSLVVGIDPAELPGRVTVPPGFSADGLDEGPLADVVAAASLKAPTSGGSTGRPKIIVSTQPATVGSVAPFARLLGMAENGALLITGPLSHNAPFLMSFCGLALGNQLVVMPRFVAEEALALVEQHCVDWMYAVPTMMARIWKLPTEQRCGFDVSSLRVVMHMAAPCPPWLKREWIEWLGAERVWELYGATEVQSVTVVRGDEWLERPGTVGRPVVGEMEIRDANGAPLPAGVVGELWMRRGAGEANPYRYIGAEAKAAESGWESVGDMASMDADGYVYLSDRDTDMILVGGANVYPAEIEAALMEHPQVRSAVVIGLRDDDLGQVPHALIELDGEDVADDVLHEHVAARLVRYKQPRSFERVSGPLRDDAGKVRRSALVAERTR